MKKYSFFLLTMLGIFFTGCQKIRDYLHLPDNTEPPKCQVVAILDNNIYPDESYVNTVHYVKYNDAGYPELVTEYANKSGFVYEDKNLHLYDDQNRLIQEGIDRGSTPNSGLRRYVYEGNSPMPILDTLYRRPKVYVEQFEYDSQHRITRILRRQVSEPEENTQADPDIDLRYYYDIRGNRQENPSNPDYPGLIQYSDKPSLYSLHPVWQLSYRDFSRNSTLTATTYNDKGLPTQFADSTTTYFQPFLNADPGATVQYECEN